MQMQSKYKLIIDFIRKSDVVLFIGAGFSIKAGTPSGSDLCDAIYKGHRMGEVKTTSGHFQIAVK